MRETWVFIPKIPIRLLLEPSCQSRSECTNLVVPIAVSSSHIAFGSNRMEPMFMILGQSAGTIASLAIEKQIEIHELSYVDIRARLLKDKRILVFPIK